MPTYTFRCPECEAVQERFCRVSELDANTPECHGPMRIVIQPAHGHVKMECRYKCPVTGEGVTSWKQRRESFARHNLSDAASDMSADQVIASARKKKEANDRVAAGMPHGNDYKAVYG